MAVAITSKFYQDDEWKDISKVVFTSPNMISPATAGTRSHILPGEGALGLWYEDTSEMFRIEDHQWATDSDFYNYRIFSKNEVNLQDAVGYIDVVNPNYNNFDLYIKENASVDIDSYSDQTGLIIDSETRLEYRPLQECLDEIHNTSDDRLTTTVQVLYTGVLVSTGGTINYFDAISYIEKNVRTYGWYTPVIEEIPQCYITFTFSEPTKVVYVEMSSIMRGTEITRYTYAGSLAPSSTIEENEYNKYFIGNYNIQASNDEVSWTILYTGANTDNLDKSIYLSNTQYYKYYRLNILNNTSLNDTTFDRDFYGLRNLRFNAYQFSTDPGSESIVLYEFNDLDNPKVLKISNAYPRQAALPTLTTTSDDNLIEGSIYISHTTVSGQATIYEVNINDVADEYDNLVTATCTSSTISGVGSSTSANTYLKQDNISVTCDAAAWYDDPTAGPEYTMFFTCQGTKSVVVDTVDWVGETEITYITVASGITVSGTNYASLSGYTTRITESSLYERVESYRLVIDEYVTNSGIILENEPLYIWGNNDATLDLDATNSVVFEVTNGEAYNCRLTAWDDVTHSTIINELIQGDHVRCSCAAYCASNSKLDPGELEDPLNLVYPPAHNRIFKGNTNLGGYKYYYGDFDLIYRYQSGVYGDFVIVKPMLYGIDSSISYGVHDYILTLHYSYT